jgi:hypothetical protein
MIKRLNGTELSTTRTRAGLSSISELLPRLIRSYELQAELVKRRTENPRPATPVVTMPVENRVQGTFAWYE